MTAIGGFDAITIDCADPMALGRFWAEVFGTDIGPTDGEEPQYADLLPAPGVPIIRFQRVSEGKTVKNRVHLDVSVEDLEEAATRVEALGAQRLSAEPFGEYGYRWLVMADPEGNEFCLVIAPGT